MSLQPIRRTVISVGTIPNLLSLREQVMQGAGYRVFTTMDPEEAAIKMDSGGYDVLLLCYSVEDDWRNRLIAHFRAHCPNGRIVAVTNHPIAESPKEVDSLVYGVEGPEALMDAIQGRAA